MKALFVLAILGLVVSPVLAGDWLEVDDATDLPPGQETVGEGTLDNIFGFILPGGDADMYCINIPDPALFGATTCGNTIDTQLFLFDADGVGLAFNDDDPGGCGLQSTLTGTFVPGPGTYLLAISTYDWDPAGPNGDIWEDSPFGVERAPDGPGAPGPVVGWGGTAFSEGDYFIALRGTEYCGGATATEATTWGAIKAIYR